MAAIGAFEYHETVFFVGATGTKAGIAKPGGMRKDTWVERVAAVGSAAAIAELIGTNGAAKKVATATVTDDPGNYLEITADTPGDFADVIDGMVVNLDFDAKYADGWFTVLTHTDDLMVIEYNIPDANDNEAVTCTFGGAFDTLQNALDNTDAEDQNVFICTNKDETLAAAIDVDTALPTLADNTHFRIIGYKTAPPGNSSMTDGDMDKGGTYYGGALDAYKSENSLTAYMENSLAECVTIDGDGGAWDIFALNNFDCFHIRNLYLKNIANTNSLISYTNTPRGGSIQNCKFTDARYALNGTINGLFLYDSYVESDGSGSYSTINTSGSMINMDTCVVYNPSTETGIKIRFGSITNTLVIGGIWGISVQEGGSFSNNTFYNQTGSCISADVSTSPVVAFNNIFVPAVAASDYAVGRRDTTPPGSGSIIYSDYSCGWSIDEAEPLWVDKGPNSIGEDPDFVDEANGDFRPRNPNVLRGGKPDAAGNPMPRGAVLQKYQFADRSRIGNPTRLSIIR